MDWNSPQYYFHMHDWSTCTIIFQNGVSDSVYFKVRLFYGNVGVAAMCGSVSKAEVL